MQKQITLRFPSKCRKCGNGILAGESAYWFGHKAGVSHINCTPSEEGKTEINVPKNFDASERITFDWTELREAYLKWTTEGYKSVFSETNRNEGTRLPQ